MGPIHIYIPWTRDRPLLAKRSCFDMGHFEMFKIRPCVQNTAFSVFTENWRFSSVRQFGIFFSPKSPFLYTYVFRANQPLLECITLAKAWSWLPHCQNKSSIIIMKSNWKTFEGAQIKTFENISHQIGVSIHATVIYHGSFQTCLNLNQASPQKASVSLPNVRHSWNLTWLSYKVFFLLAWCSQRWHHPWRSGSDTAQLQSRVCNHVCLWVKREPPLASLHRPLCQACIVPKEGVQPLRQFTGICVRQPQTTLIKKRHCDVHGPGARSLGLVAGFTGKVLRRTLVA